MIIHIRINIPQRARRNHTHPPKRNTNQINPPIALRIRHLSRLDNDPVRRLIPRDAGDETEFVEEGGSGQDDGGADGVRVRDAEVEFHGAADVVEGVVGEFGGEDVVVGCVADGAADDADGEGEGCDGGDEVLKQISKVSLNNRGFNRVGCGLWMENGLETLRSDVRRGK